MKIDIVAWRSEQHDDCVYVVQVNNIKHGDSSIIKKIFQEWNTISHGWNVKEDFKILILKKTFISEKHWQDWAKKCPMKVVEYKYRAGKTKIIQLSCKTRKKRAKNAKKE